MAKIKLDESLVDSALDTIDSAKSKISSVEGEMSSALGLITGARGSEYIDTSAMQTGLTVQSDNETKIEDTVEVITSMVAEIKKWNEDVENMGFGERLLSTLGMGISKIGEGFLGAGEQLVDGFASLIGWGAGKLGMKDAQDSIANFIAKDHVGDAFHNFYYNTDFGKRMTQASYMSENGKLANVCKLVGTAVGYTAALSVTGLGASMAASAGAAGIGAMGGTMQAGLANGMDYDTAFRKGLKNAAISAALVVGVSYGIRAASPYIKKGFDAVKNKLGFGEKALAVSDDLARETGNIGDDFADDFVDDFTENATKGNKGGPKDTGFENAGNNPNPKNPTGGSGGGGEAAQKFSSRDELIKAMEEGHITKDEAIRYAEEQFKNATTRAEQVAWHSDPIEGAAHKMKEAAEAAAKTNTSSTAEKVVEKATNISDDLERAATPNPGNTPVSEVKTPNVEPTVEVKTPTVEPTVEVKAPTVETPSVANPPAVRANAPTVTDTPLDEMMTASSKVTPSAEVPSAVNTPTAGAKAPTVINTPADEMTASLGSKATPSVEVPSVANPSAAGAKLPTVSDTPFDDVITASSKATPQSPRMPNENVIDVEYTEILKDGTHIHHNTAGEITNVTPGKGPLALPDKVAGISDDLERAAATPNPAETSLTTVEKAAGIGDELTNSVKPNASVAGDANLAKPSELAADIGRKGAADPVAYDKYAQQYADKLDDLDKLKNTFDDLGGRQGNAPQAEFDAVKAKMNAVENDLADLGQKMENAWNGPQSSAKVPAETPQLPAEIPGNSPQLPAEVPGGAKPVTTGNASTQVGEQLGQMGDEAGNAVRNTPHDPVAYDKYAQQYADKLDDLDKLKNTFDDLGGKQGNAPQAEFDAVKTQMNAVENDLADLGQKMENAWNGPQSPAKVPEAPQLPAEIPGKGPQLPAEVPSGAEPVSTGNTPTKTLQFNEGDDLTSLAEKLDKEVELGNLTRQQADDLFVEAGEKLQLQERGRIAELQAENAGYEQAKAANIERKGLLQEVDGAKPESVRGYDEAVRQLDEKMAANNAELESLKAAVGDGPKTFETQIPNKAELPAVKGGSTDLVPVDQTLPAEVPIKGTTDLVPVKGESTALVPVKGESTALVPVKGEPTAVVPVEGETTALVPVKGEPTGLVPVKGEPTAIVPVKGEPTGLVPVKGEPTGIVPVKNGEAPIVPVEEAGPLAPIEEPVIPPVKPPVPSGFVAKLPPVTDPGTIPLTTPEPVKRDDLTLDPIVKPDTPDVPDPTPSDPTPTDSTPGGGSPGGGSPGGGTPTPSTTTPPTTTSPTTASPTTASPTTASPTTASPTTASPTTASPTTSQPTSGTPDPYSEYAPIPDTMTGKKSARDYILPAAIGGVVGAAGLAAAHALRDNDKEYLEDDDDDEDDDYNNEYFEDIKEEV